MNSECYIAKSLIIGFEVQIFVLVGTPQDKDGSRGYGDLHNESDQLSR
jgi:hypothetical protein